MMAANLLQSIAKTLCMCSKGGFQGISFAQVAFVWIIVKIYQD